MNGMRMRLAALGLVALLLPLAGASCGDSGDLQVFAAISLRQPLEEIAVAFQARHPDIHVSFNFAGSQRLRFQLEQGAAADVFVSANNLQMQLAGQSGLLDGEASIFAHNRLAIAAPASNPANVMSPKDLAMPGLRFVWADDAVPLGAYSRQVLASFSEPYGADFPQRVAANAVSQEANAEAVAGKVELGEADAAIVYETDARRLRSLGAVIIPIPDDYQPDISFLAASLSEAGHPALARGFVAFLQSDEAQHILLDHAFLGVR